ncbi:MAG: hypothetical protein GX639_06130 [Fibrobacter sp.]|nr:hypothetical protein [Fibrobacter sp.]
MTIIAKAFRFYSEISDSSNVRWEDAGVATVTYTEILQVPQVQIMPVCRDSIGVFMFSPDRNATIYYTTNGSDPDSFSNKYTDVFRLASDAIVKAVVIKAGSINSNIVTAQESIVNVNLHSENKTGTYLRNDDVTSVLLNGKVTCGKSQLSNNSVLLIKSRELQLKTFRKY